MGETYLHIRHTLTSTGEYLAVYFCASMKVGQLASSKNDTTRLEKLG